MRIAVAADHAGFRLKQALCERLEQAGHQVVDLGTLTEDSTDYPDYALEVGRRVAGGEADRGLLVCTTGIGMSIAANKVSGIRAALAMNDEAVRLTRAHNDANVLAIGSKFAGYEEAARYVDIFLHTPFEGGERHSRRLGKITAFENETHSQESRTSR